MELFSTPGPWMGGVALLIFALGSGLVLLGLRMGGGGSKRYGTALRQAENEPGSLPFAYRCPLEPAQAITALERPLEQPPLDVCVTRREAHVLLWIEGRHGAAFGAPLLFEAVTFPEAGGCRLLLQPMEAPAEAALREDGTRLWVDAYCRAACGAEPFLPEQP